MPDRTTETAPELVQLTTLVELNQKRTLSRLAGLGRRDGSGDVISMAAYVREGLDMVFEKYAGLLDEGGDTPLDAA